MRRPTQDENGAVAIMVSLLTVVLVLIVAFVTDFGMAYANQKSLQNGVDAAALAAARSLNSANPTATCADMTTPAMVLAARTVAESYFRGNVPNTAAKLAAGDQGFDARCTNDDKQVLVSVAATQDSPSFFGGIAGVHDVPISKAAKAIIGTAKDPVGVRPFALCQNQANLLKATPGAVLTFSFGNSDSGCGSASGAFGLLDLDGAVSGGADALKGWVKDGYPTTLTDLENLLSENGNEFGALPIQSMMDQEVVFPVYDSVEKLNGKNHYHGVGYVTVQACAFDKKSPPQAKGGCYSSANWNAAIAADGGNDYHLQVKFVTFTPVADIALNCQLGNVGCDFGSRVVKLAN